MILSTTQELRLHDASNAIDEVSILQGNLDNSEKDFLKDKLGESLYTALCNKYQTIDIEDYHQSVLNGTYTENPWYELLNLAQRMIVNDALAAHAYQQLLSINGSGINIASSNDYAAANEKVLDKGVSSYRKDAMISCNNLLLLLEGWSKQIGKSTPIVEGESSDNPSGDISDTPSETPLDSSSDVSEESNLRNQVIVEIVTLWQESRYYYLHHDLLIPTCTCLIEYMPGYNNRDKFISLLPELRFIQRHYIAQIIGKDTLAQLLTSEDPKDEELLHDVRYLMVAYLKERTNVLDFDKYQRQLAHDDAVSLKESILETMDERQRQVAEKTATSSVQVPSQEGVSKSDISSQKKSETSQGVASSSTEGFKNNQEGDKIFVTPLLF